MLGTPNDLGSTGQSLPGQRYGFRRVEHVHIRLDNGHSVATVTGVVRRYPRTVRVPFGVAARLVAAGAPLTVESTDPHRG